MRIVFGEALVEQILLSIIKVPCAAKLVSGIRLCYEKSVKFSSDIA